MTIGLRKVLSPDLVNHEGWPLFSGRLDLKGRYSSVAAYTLVWTGSDIDGSSLSAFAVNDLHSYFLRAVEGLDCGLQMLAANLTMQPKTAMVLHRKLWRNLLITPVPNGVELGPEKIIACATGVRFAGLANVSLADVPWMVEIAYKFGVVVPLISANPFKLSMEDSPALDLVRVAFPPDGCSVQGKMDWAGFVCQAASMGCISVRLTGSLAAGEIEADFFGPEAQVSALVSAFERDNGSISYQLQ